VKVLIEKTAYSLDDTALKILFVSVQQNNIDLCIRYAIENLTNKIGDYDIEFLTWCTMLWFGHSFLPGYVRPIMILICAIRDWHAVQNYDKLDEGELGLEQRRIRFQQEHIFFRFRQVNFQQERFPLEQDAHALAFFLHWHASNASSLSAIISFFNLNLKSSLIFFAALLICMENTFWNIHKDVNFVKLFKASFSLYVESGMRKKAEAAIDILRRERGGHRVTKDFQEKFHKIIVEHCLSHPGDQASEMPVNERKKSWLQRLMQKKL